MENVPLDDLVSRLGQARVARALGVKPASIAKAIRTRRNIMVMVNADGSCIAKEIRPFPSKLPESQGVVEPISSCTV